MISTPAATVAAGAADHVLVYRSLTQATDRTHGPARRAHRGCPDPGLPRASYAPLGLHTRFRRTSTRSGSSGICTGSASPTKTSAAIPSWPGKHAATNPAAYFYGRPITLEDHQNRGGSSSPILRLLDCCQTNDGAVAVIVTTPERAAADLPGQSVIVEATSQSHLRDGRRAPRLLPRRPHRVRRHVARPPFGTRPRGSPPTTSTPR